MTMKPAKVFAALLVPLISAIAPAEITGYSSSWFAHYFGYSNHVQTAGDQTYFGVGFGGHSAPITGYGATNWDVEEVGHLIDSALFVDTPFLLEVAGTAGVYASAAQLQPDIRYDTAGAEVGFETSFTLDAPGTVHITYLNPISVQSGTSHFSGGVMLDGINHMADSEVLLNAGFHTVSASAECRADVGKFFNGSFMEDYGSYSVARLGFQFDVKIESNATPEPATYAALSLSVLALRKARIKPRMFS